ncbi:MAG: hypothetical protein ACRCTX_20985, partial [Afipia sp.]
PTQFRVAKQFHGGEEGIHVEVSYAPNTVHLHSISGLLGLMPIVLVALAGVPLPACRRAFKSTQ